VDGLKVWVCFIYLPTQGWDIGIPGSTPITLSNELQPSSSLKFIHDATAHSSRVKNKATAKETLQLPRRYEKPTATHCDAQYVAAGYKSGELLILDFSQMIPK